MSSRALAHRERPRSHNGDDSLVEELMKISKKVFGKLTPAEREERLSKLKTYLASLDDESVAKRA